MYGKKIIASVALVATVAVSAAMFAAFEAHVINVTAKIENALYVPIDHIDFGTVFPQEELDRALNIRLSDSFMEEDRVDDVEYIIRQKPKCGWTTDDGTILLDYPTMTGHVEDDGSVTCPTPEPIPVNADWGQLPLLCPYLSKHKADTDPDENQTEVEIPAFHQPWTIDPAGVAPVVTYLDAKGRLAKSDDDFEDSWIIDLKVPCFGDHCAQDWESFVLGINDTADPSLYVQPIENEHKIFGCDLWVEVTEVSESNGEDLACVDADVMLVLDRSGSIDAGELATLKTAAEDFVDALIPAVPTTDTHMGQTSFADVGSLDLNLTDDVTAIKAAINGLSTGGFTNLMEGITYATTELTGGDRTPDADYPDYMVVITDGAPNRPTDETAAKVAAANAADAARAVGIKIYVVGIGTDAATATYLSDEIANNTGQYYDASDYASLSAVLADIATCNP